MHRGCYFLVPLYNRHVYIPVPLCDDRRLSSAQLPSSPSSVPIWARRLALFMIFTISPIKALLFLVFLIILQQLEAQPYIPKSCRVLNRASRHVGAAAVTVGGSIGGIPGMLVGVPLAATAYKLLRDDVHGRCRPSKTPDGKDQTRNRKFPPKRNWRRDVLNEKAF